MARRNVLETTPHPLRATSSTKIALYGIFVLGFLGFLDATYLTIQHFSGQIPPCDVTHGCETVLTSQFATVGPIPIAAFGIGYFVIIMVLSILYFQKKQSGTQKVLFTLSSLAFLAGLGLIYIQAFVLHAFCQFCLAAELLIMLIFILSGWVYFREEK